MYFLWIIIICIRDVCIDPNYDHGYIVISSVYEHRDSLCYEELDEIDKHEE